MEGPRSPLLLSEEFCLVAMPVFVHCITHQPLHMSACDCKARHQFCRIPGWPQRRAFGWLMHRDRCWPCARLGACAGEDKNAPELKRAHEVLLGHFGCLIQGEKMSSLPPLTLGVTQPFVDVQQPQACKVGFYSGSEPHCQRVCKILTVEGAALKEGVLSR